MERNWDDFKQIFGNIEGARAAFEEACETLLRKIYPDQTVQIVQPNPGDEGIDILVGEIGVAPIKVFQCKFFLRQIGKSQRRQIRKSFSTAIQAKRYRMSEWTLCVPKALDIEELSWWSDWKNRTEQE
ncbi:MAG: hypothetical protein HC880_08455, partial [Bacteroidia bacterium]|nr:hypothetical protein [Bacteroidia bacterium]